MITIHLSTIDHHREKRKYKTLKGAQKFAQNQLGKYPSIGRGYAVDDYGACKIQVEGCTLLELFPGAL